MTINKLIGLKTTIQNLCYISVAQRFIKKKKKEGLFVNENSLSSVVWGLHTLYCSANYSKMLELSGWAALPVSASEIIKFDSDLILSMAMQNIGTEPSNPVYW